MGDQPIERNFCTTRDAANRLGVSVGTIQFWVESGVLDAWKTAGGHRRVMVDSVDRLLRKGTGSVSRSQAAQPPRPSILVVEDDIHLLRLYETRLSRWPLAPQVICVNNPVLALLRIGRSSPDLLILDLNMPGMDGFTMLNSLRNSPEIGSTMIAVVSGMERQEIERLGGLPGDVEVFPKPVPFNSLLKLWNSMTAQGRFGDTLAKAVA